MYSSSFFGQGHRQYSWSKLFTMEANCKITLDSCCCMKPMAYGNPTSPLLHFSHGFLVLELGARSPPTVWDLLGVPWLASAKPSARQVGREGSWASVKLISGAPSLRSLSLSSILVSLWEFRELWTAYRHLGGGEKGWLFVCFFSSPLVLSKKKAFKICSNLMNFVCCNRFCQPACLCPPCVVCPHPGFFISLKMQSVASGFGSKLSPPQLDNEERLMAGRSKSPNRHSLEMRKFKSDGYSSPRPVNEERMNSICTMHDY